MPMRETEIVLAKKIKELRTLNNWTLKDLSKKLGVDYRTLSKYEQELSPIPAHIAYEYTQIFHVTLNSLYDVKESLYDEFCKALNELSEKQRNAVMTVIESYK